MNDENKENSIANFEVAVDVDSGSFDLETQGYDMETIEKVEGFNLVDNEWSERVDESEFEGLQSAGSAVYHQTETVCGSTLNPPLMS